MAYTFCSYCIHFESGKCKKKKCDKKARNAASRKRLEERKEKYASLPEEERGKAAACKIMKCDDIFSMANDLYNVFRNRKEMQQTFPTSESFMDEFKKLNKETMISECSGSRLIHAIAGAEFYAVTKANGIKITQEEIAENLLIEPVTMRSVFQESVMKTGYWTRFLKMTRGIDLDVESIKKAENDIESLIKERKVILKEYHEHNYNLFQRLNDKTISAIDREKEEAMVDLLKDQFNKINEKLWKRREELSKLRNGEKIDTR